MVAETADAARCVASCAFPTLRGAHRASPACTLGTWMKGSWRTFWPFSAILLNEMESFLESFSVSIALARGCGMCASLIRRGG